LAALPEALIIRKSLEETTAKLAAERATPSQILGLRSLIERQAEAISAEDQEAFHRADEDFHAALAKAAGYPGVWALVQQVKFHIDRCRRLANPQQGRMARARREHIAIAEGVEARDPVRAATAMAAHLDGLLGDIFEIQKLNPDYFDAAPKPPKQ
jgi:DNA-binding GntR family transcriptional regulator